MMNKPIDGWMAEQIDEAHMTDRTMSGMAEQLEDGWTKYLDNLKRILEIQTFS